MVDRHYDRQLRRPDPNTGGNGIANANGIADGNTSANHVRSE